MKMTNGNRSQPHEFARRSGVTVRTLHHYDRIGLIGFKYTSDEKRVRLRAFAADGNVLFEVRDNGIGISPRETKKIFRRFYQVDQGLSRNAGGCGCRA